MKKLLFISNVTNRISNFSYPSYLACKEMGIEFHLASNLDNFDYENNPYKDIIFHNIECDRNPFSIKNFKSYKILNQIIKENGIDYIHCNTPIGGFLGRICGHKNKVSKIIYTAHGFHFYDGAPLVNNLLYKSIERYLAHFTDVIITMNEEDYQNAKKMKLRNNGKVYKINGVGINLEEYQNIQVDKHTKRKELGLRDDDFVCIGVGRVEKNKNYEMTIRSIAQINNKKVQLLICGDGPQQEKLKKISKQLKIENQVHFLGFRSDIKELLSISDCYISTSKREGLPRALMEAMAVGLPCVASDIRGNRDLIMNEGTLINSSKTAVEQILTIMNDSNYENYLRKSNLDAIQLYDRRKVIQQISFIYGSELKIHSIRSDEN